MYPKRLSQFHPTTASSGSSSADHASYCAASPRVHVAPLMDELPPSVLPLFDQVDKRQLPLARTLARSKLTYPWMVLFWSVGQAQSSGPPYASVNL